MGPEEFQRALITVLVAGIVVMAIGTTAVYLVLRGFGRKPEGRSHVAIAAGLIGFIFLCCLALFALSYGAH